MTAVKRSALVFGGSRGIGAACVSALSADGWRVAYTYLNSAAPASEQAYAADMRDPAAVAAAFERAERSFGGALDAVVVNAGVNVPGAPLASFSPENFRLLLEINLVGAFNVLAEAARRVADGGAIIAVTTSLVRHAVPGAGPYTATKAAVESLARSLAKELAPRKVRVNCVAPGPVDTDLFNAGKTEEMKKRMAAMSPFDRIGRPEEVAKVVAFLASEDASWVHGQIVQPNGGMV